MSGRWERAAAVIALVVAGALAAGDAFGCPNCKDAFDTSGSDGANIARGYFYSILLMLAMPFTLAGSFGAYVWREMRRQRAQAGADACEPCEQSRRPEP
jgi:hypothetical protein